MQLLSSCLSCDEALHRYSIIIIIIAAVVVVVIDIVVVVDVVIFVAAVAVIVHAHCVFAQITKSSDYSLNSSASEPPEHLDNYIIIAGIVNT